MKNLGCLCANVARGVPASIVVPMKRLSNYRRSVCCGVGLALLAGCASRSDDVRFSSGSFEHYHRMATQTSYTDQYAVSTAAPTEQPLSLESQPRSFRDLPLEEALQLGLQNSPVLRDLGGVVLRSPQTTRTVQQPALVELDPRLGVEAALSEFDTTFAARTNWEKNDRALNNLLLGGGTNFFKQDLGVAQFQLQKRAATGSLFTLRHNIDYDANSAPANLFGSAWNTNIEGEFRQPLLQNAGVLYNRIGGPSGQPGQYNGVLIARTNTDMALADFETGVRDLVSNIENAYWDLYYAYRDLDAKIAARDSALDSWRRVQALNAAGRKGGEAEKEAEAREQYFRFQEEVQNALAGRLIDGTQTHNGSSGGSFRATGGVQVAERRLRLLLGLPITDGALLRPADQPSLARVSFDWPVALAESLTRRSELRKQQWLVKRRELELIASRNFLMPNLDTVGRYRWRGFGKDLLDPASNGATFDDSYENLFDGQFQEWQVGLELNMPLGYRRGHVAARHAELQLARERTLLREQEREIQLGLSNAVAELERAFAAAQTNYNRRAAAKEHLAAIQAAYESDKATLDLVLEAQRRAAESESRFHASLVEYALAIRNVHFEKGTLLDYNQVALAEGPWPDQAYRDAARRDGRGTPLTPINYAMRKGPRIDGGAVPQRSTMPTQTASAPTTVNTGTSTQPEQLPPAALPGQQTPPQSANPPIQSLPQPTTGGAAQPPSAINSGANHPLLNPGPTGLLPSNTADTASGIVPAGVPIRDDLRPYLPSASRFVTSPTAGTHSFGVEHAGGVNAATPTAQPVTNTASTAVSPTQFTWPPSNNGNAAGTNLGNTNQPRTDKLIQPAGVFEPLPLPLQR